jgi:hypothetical protein
MDNDFLEFGKIARKIGGFKIYLWKMYIKTG